MKSSFLPPLSAPSLPPEAGDEGARLQALRRYDILDTPSEDAFDRVTALATRLFGVSAALIGLIDNHRTWYKSTHGIVCDEVLRELSFCARVIEANDLCWSEDLATDPAWAGHPLSLGGHPCRFFAAAPVRSLEGQVLGTLCIVHPEPRAFTESDRQTLCDLAGIVTDELELRRIARARWDSAARDFSTRYSELFEANPHPMWIFDTETLRFLSVNKAAVESYGYSRDEFLAMTLTDIRPVEDRTRLQASIPKDPIYTSRELWRHQKKDGSIIEVEISSGPVAIADGRRARLVLAYDISARRHAEESLLAQDRYLAAVVETQRQLLDCETVDECLPGILGVLGEAAQACRASYFENGCDADDRLYCELKHEWCAPGVDFLRGTAAGMRVYPEAFSPRWLKQLLQGKAVNVVATDPSLHEPERQYLAARHALSLMFAPVMVESEFAGVLSFHCCKEPHRLGLGERNPLLTAASAIAQALERERVGQQLLQEKERLAVTLASITEAVITADLPGRVVLLNRVAEELTGWSSADALGRPLTEVFVAFATGDPESGQEPLTDPLARVLTTGRAVSQSRSLWLRSREGEERRRIAMSTTPIYDRSGKVTGAVRVFRDVSDQEKLTEEMIKASKLESVGLLAGGIAHDFNNILTAVLGNLSLGRLFIEQNQRAASLGKLDEAERACLRAKDLTAQLLTFAKGGAPVKRLARLPEIIRESVGFALHGSQVACRFFFDETSLWPVEADVGQLSQVLSNLAINAVQAMPRGGSIEVRAENLFLPENSDSELPPGAYLKISIEDEGCGISPEHMLHIFDPFFSTKEHGTGLGLATSYSIIHKHGGRLTADSVQGIGTVFRIYLPAKLEAQSMEETPALGTSLPPPQPAGRGRILLLDDESAILDLAGSMLEYLGYQVTPTSYGHEAVAAYRQALAEGQPYAAAILDLTVPGGLDGRAVAAALREMDPKVRAIVSSGYSNDPVMGDSFAYGFCGVLSKPYRMDELAAVLTAALGPSSTASAQ